MKANFSFQPKTQTLRRFQLLETRSYFLLIGTDKMSNAAHVLQLSRLADTHPNVTLKDVVQEVPKTLNQSQLSVFLNKLTNDEKVSRRVPRAYGVLGFVKFLKGYYVILVTGRKREARIGQHSIYQVKKTEMVSLFMLTDNANRDEENFYLNLFQSSTP